MEWISKEEALKSIVYSYKHGFSGFAAMPTEAQAEELSSNHHHYRTCNWHVQVVRQTYAHIYRYACILIKDLTCNLGLDGVVFVKPDALYEMQTTRSWDVVLGDINDQQSARLQQKAKFGQDIIVGVVDSGLINLQYITFHFLKLIRSHQKNTT